MSEPSLRERLGAPMVFQVRPLEIREGRDGTYRATAVGYLDRCDVQTRLDDVFGPEGWSVAFQVIDPDKGQVECRISAKVGGEWVTKADIGSPGNSDEDNLLKGAASDALKRAATQWGIGRFLYDIGRTALPCKVWTGKDGKVRFDSWVGADPIAAILDGARKAGIPWALTYDHKAKPASPGDPSDTGLKPPAEGAPPPPVTGPSASADTPPMPSLEEVMAHAGVGRLAVSDYCRAVFGKERPSKLAVGEYEQLLAALRAGKVKKSAASAA